MPEPSEAERNLTQWDALTKQVEEFYRAVTGESVPVLANDLDWLCARDQLIQAYGEECWEKRHAK